MGCMFYVEARARGLSHEWKPVTVLLGNGKWAHTEANTAVAEVDVWTRTPYGQVYEFRVRREEKPAPAVPTLAKPSGRVEQAEPLEPAAGRGPNKRKPAKA